MQIVKVYLTDHHRGSAESLAKIIKNDWPVLKAIHINGGVSHIYECEHSKSCTDCQAEMGSELNGVE